MHLASFRVGKKCPPFFGPDDGSMYIGEIKNLTGEMSPSDSDFFKLRNDNNGAIKIQFVLIILFKCAKQSTAGCDAGYAVSGNELQNFQRRFA